MVTLSYHSKRIHKNWNVIFSFVSNISLYFECFCLVWAVFSSMEACNWIILFFPCYHWIAEAGNIWGIRFIEIIILGIQWLGALSSWVLVWPLYWSHIMADRRGTKEHRRKRKQERSYILSPGITTSFFLETLVEFMGTPLILLQGAMFSSNLKIFHILKFPRDQAYNPQNLSHEKLYLNHRRHQ